MIYVKRLRALTEVEVVRAELLDSPVDSVDMDMAAKGAGHDAVTSSS